MKNEQNGPRNQNQNSKIFEIGHTLYLCFTLWSYHLILSFYYNFQYYLIELGHKRIK